MERCLELAQSKLFRMPGKLGFRMALQILWQFGIVSIPPEAAPYITGEYIMNTDRLKKFLGEDYERVIEKTNFEAFADSFRQSNN